MSCTSPNQIYLINKLTEGIVAFSFFYAERVCSCLPCVVVRLNRLKLFVGSGLGNMTKFGRISLHIKNINLHAQHNFFLFLPYISRQERCPGWLLLKCDLMKLQEKLGTFVHSFRARCLV